MGDMRRTSHHSTVTIAESASQSDAIDIRRDSGGLIEVSAAWTAADIGFLVAIDENGTYRDLLDSSGARVKITTVTAASIHDVPEAVMKASHVKLESINTSTEAAVNQAADRTLYFIRKS